MISSCFVKAVEPVGGVGGRGEGGPGRGEVSLNHP